MERAQPFNFRPDLFPVVAVGVDTLHYTAPIELKRGVVERLQSLQEAARAERAELLHLGELRGRGNQVVKPGLPFLALPRSIKRYRWGVACEAFGITVWLTDSKKVKGVKVEIGSRALWHFGQEEAYRLTRRVVNQLCEIGDGWPARPARCDFTVDFQGMAFHHDMQLAMVTRARTTPEFESQRGVCPACDAAYLDGEASLCGRCGAPRRKYVETTRELPAPATDLAGERVRGARHVVKVPTLVSAERSLNPHLLSRAARLALGTLAMTTYGGNRRKPFTGWSFGNGDPLMVRLYEKTLEVRTKSPDKAWFYDVWNRSDGYTHSYCPNCGREHAKAQVLAADAPYLRDELPLNPPRMPKRYREVREALGLDDELAGNTSGLPRLAARVCDHCSREHKVVPVWRLEVQTRGDLLTCIAPDGVNRIETVDDVIKNADELWLHLVGQAYRYCPSCNCVPIGKAARWRTCRNCVAKKKAELGRDLQKHELKAFAMRRRRGWIEARDATGNLDGDTSRMPVTPWWQHLQSIHFEFSAPATATSAKLKNLVSADINRTMARGCITSWAHAVGLVERLEQQLGRPPNADEFKDGIWREMFGNVDPMELYALVAYKDVTAGKPLKLLAPGRAPPAGGPPALPPRRSNELEELEELAAPSPRLYREVVFHWRGSS